MKKIGFVSKRRMIAEGLQAAMTARPELGLQLLPMIPLQHARRDSLIYSPDVALVDVPSGMAGPALMALCRGLREDVPGIRLLLLLSEDDTPHCDLLVQARQTGLADDFVFYDNSMSYLLAKLAAL